MAPVCVPVNTYRYRISFTAPAFLGNAWREGGQAVSKWAAKVFFLLIAQKSDKASMPRASAIAAYLASCTSKSTAYWKGLIAMTIPHKPRSCLQRCRLTPQGRALLAALNTKENPGP